MQDDLDRYASRRSTVYGQRGMVATSQPLAASAGVSVLRDGGNAFDAAVATAAALNVVEPTSTGIGGDVFALYRTANGEIGGMQACGHAPAAATIENVREAIAGDPDADVSMPAAGPHTVTVPGTARGWEITLDRLGTRSLADVLAPAIEYATDGFPVTPVVAQHWQGADSLFTDEHAREAYLLDGRPPRQGELMRLPALGQSMERIATDGADVVYEGEIADAIVEEVQSKGGLLTIDDLAAFEPRFVEPMSTSYRGVEVFELPPTNQGLIVLGALELAAAAGAAAQPRGSVDRIHTYVEAMKRAFVDGHRYIADPDHEPVPPLTDPEYVAERAAEISSRASTPAIGSPFGRAETADTVLLTVADEAGNLVSYINSRFAGFGSGLVAGDTGIALQNRGASFSLDPDHPNHIAPGKRPFHTLIPALARFDADDWMAFGVMGGFMQPQGHLQILTNLIDGDHSLQAALDAPRWRYQTDGSLAVEERHPFQSKLARRGHDVRIQPPEHFGGAQAIRRTGDVLAGATDPRKDGAVVTF